MTRGNFCPVLSVVAPRGAIKWLESELGCSPRQAQRIWQSGRAPASLKHMLIIALDHAMSRRRDEIARADAALRTIAAQEMSLDAVPVVPADAASNARLDVGSIAEAKETLLIDRGLAALNEAQTCLRLECSD